jgi:hypothetical protein
MSTLEPWILQEHILAELCSSGKLAPVMDTQFCYQVTGSDLLIDIMSVAMRQAQAFGQGHLEPR